MTEDQKKEAISKEFLRILAQSHGFKVLEPSPDHGVDMIVSPVITRVEPSGKVRFLDSPYKLDFQLKATTLQGVLDAGDNIKYDLEVKNYNDLVQRRRDPLPLHLVLVVLSAAPPSCITLNSETLGVAGKAYWYLPTDDAQPTENISQIRITIPKVNQLRVNFLSNRYEQLGIEL